MEFKPTTWREIGSRFNITHAAAQGSHKRLLKKLREKLMKDPVIRDWVNENIREYEHDE